MSRPAPRVRSPRLPSAWGVAGGRLLAAPVTFASSVGDAAWRTVTNVRFAVLQISVLVVAGVIGALVRQIPGAALRDPLLYAAEMADLHLRFDGLSLLGVPIGPDAVNAFEWLGFFRVFSTPWFVLLLTLLAVSIVCGTLERLPAIWKDVRYVRIVQPSAFFDESLRNRAVIPAAALERRAIERQLRKRHYRVQWRVVEAADGTEALFVYGDRNQYMKLATLVTHAGLVLFLVGGLVTAALGFETVVFVANGQTAPVMPVGTPNNLLMHNVAFAAPRLPDGRFADFSTDLEVYQDGALVARKTIRVNDPLEIGGFIVHQNTFGPAVDVSLRGPRGELLWTGPVVLAGILFGRPQGVLAVPGTDLSLLMLLDQSQDGTARLVLEGMGSRATVGANSVAFVVPVAVGEATNPFETAGYTLTFRGTDAWSGLVVKRDPGVGIIWIAFAGLVTGLSLTFYLPRRRIWLRLADGEVRIALMADRYVDGAREVDEVVGALGGDRDDGSYLAARTTA